MCVCVYNFDILYKKLEKQNINIKGLESLSQQPQLSQL